VQVPQVKSEAKHQPTFILVHFEVRRKLPIQWLQRFHI